MCILAGQAGTLVLVPDVIIEQWIEVRTVH
jgi:hypothetical protein